MPSETTAANTTGQLSETRSTIFLTMSALPHARRNDLIHAARQHCADWDDTFLAKLQFDEFVEVLAGTRKAQPVLLRVPLLHWLTVWAADRDGSAVACPKIQSHDPPGKEVGKIPGPAPSASVSGNWNSSDGLTTSPCLRLTP